MLSQHRRMSNGPQPRLTSSSTLCYDLQQDRVSPPPYLLLALLPVRGVPHGKRRTAARLIKAVCACTAANFNSCILGLIEFTVRSNTGCAFQDSSVFSAFVVSFHGLLFFQQTIRCAQSKGQVPQGGNAPFARRTKTRLSGQWRQVTGF